MSGKRRDTSKSAAVDHALRQSLPIPWVFTEGCAHRQRAVVHDQTAIIRKQNDLVFIGVDVILNIDVEGDFLFTFFCVKRFVV